ncbi:hypothetical protein K438DRAFT_1811257 [Mycena galopus ATCC 62051]|nr:hypothetical protein K438DRAFT_1811257 [Mycena galopus ATCC 62051]
MDVSTMERVPALWFPDGNLILSAHGVLFRVFKGILVARSPVFADMLADGDDSAEMLDGWPVLHLDDSAADTMYFLKAIFDYEFFAPYPAPTDFDAIHGILRLGTKYRVAPLRRRALQHLSSAHPTSLAAWDGLCGASSASTSTSNSSSASLVPAPYAGPSFDPAHLELPILTLARAARAPWVLPAAFLRAAAALAGGGLTSLDVLEGIDYTGVHVELERGDKVLLLEAGGALLGEGTSELLGFLWSPTVCPGCVHATGAGAASTSASANTSAGVPSTSTSGVMNPCTADRLAMRVAAERWRSDALLPIAVCSGWRRRGGEHEYEDFSVNAGTGASASGITGASASANASGSTGASASASGSASASASGNRPQDARGEEMDEDEEGESETDVEVEEGGRAIWGEEDFARLSVCAPCLAYMKADWAARRARFWDRLPALFQLPPWAELERERRRGVGVWGA